MKKLPLAVVTALSVFAVHAVQANSAKLINPANSHSYQRFDTTKTWLQAKNACASQGGYLATITSQAENEWIVQNNLQQSKAGIWLGASDATLEGTWTWITGEPFSYTNWYPGRPDNAWNGQDYVLLYGNGQWDDGGLPADDSSISYLCEWNTSTPELKQSWTIPNVHDCQADMFNTTARKLTSETCFNNIKGATIKVLANGDKTRMNILVPATQSNIFFFKMTFPTELRVSGLNILNSEPIPAQQSSEVADVLLLTGGEVLSNVLGKFNFPIQLITTLYPINNVGDPSFLELLRPDSVLSKELYPYQTIERHFQRPSPVSILISVDSDVPFTKFKTIMDLQKISFYIGSDINNELLVEKLGSK